MDRLCRSQWRRLVHLVAEVVRLNSLRLVGLHKRQSVRPAITTILTKVDAVNHNCHSFHHWGHCSKLGTSWIIVSISAVWLAKSSLCDVCTKLWEFMYQLAQVWSSKYAAFIFCIVLKCFTLFCAHPVQVSHSVDARSACRVFPLLIYSLSLKHVLHQCTYAVTSQEAAERLLPVANRCCICYRAVENDFVIIGQCSLTTPRVWRNRQSFLLNTGMWCTVRR
jgi:hypothetical protein